MNQEPNEEYVKKESSKISEADLEEAIKGEAKVEEKLKKVEKKLDLNVLGKFINRIRLLMMMIKDYWNKDYTEPPWTTIAMIVFAILYFLNPLDLIPDFIPVVGFLDDAAVVALVWMTIEKDLKEYAQWKNLELSLYF